MSLIKICLAEQLEERRSSGSVTHC